MFVLGNIFCRDLLSLLFPNITMTSIVSCRSRLSLVHVSSVDLNKRHLISVRCKFDRNWRYRVGASWESLSWSLPSPWSQSWGWTFMKQVLLMRFDSIECPLTGAFMDLTKLRTCALMPLPTCTKTLAPPWRKSFMASVGSYWLTDAKTSKQGVLVTSHDDTRHVFLDWARKL